VPAGNAITRAVEGDVHRTGVAAEVAIGLELGHVGARAATRQAVASLKSPPITAIFMTLLPQAWCLCPQQPVNCVMFEAMLRSTQVLYAGLSIVDANVPNLSGHLLIMICPSFFLGSSLMK
jgi:hypothetical protein